MWKSVAQGQAYKQTLLTQIDRVKNLVVRIDQEAVISLQYRMRDLQKDNQNQQAITRQLKEVLEQHTSKKLLLDEATKKDLTVRIGDAVAGRFINTFYSHLSSNPGVDRIRSKCLGRS